MCNFYDMGYVRYDYIWTNNRGGEHNLQERLDHFFATQEWEDIFPGSYVSHLIKRKSDHLPILLCLEEEKTSINSRRCGYEMMCAMMLLQVNGKQDVTFI